MKRSSITFLVLVLCAALLLGSCNNKPGNDAAPLSQELVDAAADVVYTFNKPGASNEVAASFTLPSKLIDYEGHDMDVTWRVEGGDKYVSLVPASDENQILVKVDPFADQDTPFSVKGVVKCGSFSSNEFAFNYVIKQFLISNWDYWEANTSGTAMNVKGVVVAKYPYSAENKNTGVFLQDLDGEHGYFAYRLKCDSQEAYDTDLAVGNVIVVNGKTSIYNAFREMGAGCTYTLVYGDDGKVQTSAVNKRNIDALFKAGTDFTAELDKAQGTVVTVTGAKITKIEWNKNSPETFEALGDGRVYVTIEKNGASIRLFLSTSCTYTVAQLKEDLAKIDIGYTVNVEAPVASYNEVQLYPCPGGITVTSTEVSAADKAGSELNALSVPASVSKTSEIELPSAGASYKDVAVTWAVSGSSGASISGGKLSVTVGKAIEKLTLTATATCGSESRQREFTILVIPADLSEADIVNAVYALDKGAVLPGSYTLTGKVTKIDTPYSAQHGNITVTIQVGDMADKPIQCYRLTGEGADTIAVGDVITVTGTLKHYYNSNSGASTYEFDAGCGFKRGSEPGTGSDEAGRILDELYALAPGAAMEGTYTLSGTVTKVNTPFDAGYNNVTVTITVAGHDDKPVQCFRMTGTGADKVKVGDRITVSGKLKNYKGTKEFDAGCTLDSIDFSAEDTTPKYTTQEEIVKALYALPLGDSLAGGPYTLAGVVKTVDTPYSAEHQNVTVTIIVAGLNDYPVMCFRLEGTGADTIKVGDTVTVRGQLKNYNSNGTPTYEFTTGCTIEKIG
jgi:DNA/RNA endonuclease YhcR with UshA esterase domain